MAPAIARARELAYTPPPSTECGRAPRWRASGATCPTLPGVAVTAPLCRSRCPQVRRCSSGGRRQRPAPRIQHGPTPPNLHTTPTINRDGSPTFRGHQLWTPVSVLLAPAYWESPHGRRWRHRCKVKYDRPAIGLPTNVMEAGGGEGHVVPTTWPCTSGSDHSLTRIGTAHQHSRATLFVSPPPRRHPSEGVEQSGMSKNPGRYQQQPFDESRAIPRLYPPLLGCAHGSSVD